jgi:rhodanese-related sulfurtransferase
MDRLLDYFTNHPLLAGGFLAMVVVVLAYEIRERGAAAFAVAPNEAIRLANAGAVLVDLRSPNQFKDGHIAGARNLPGDQIAADPKTVSRLADKTVVLYCDNGMTTAAAQRTLAQAGVKNVFSLRGGLAAWKQENLPVVKG